MANQDEQKNLKKAIIETIVFFNIFDFPLTAFEIWKYLSIQCNLSDVQAILLGICADMPAQLPAESPRGDSAEAKKASGRLCRDENATVEQKNGFYFLVGREEIVVTRMKRYNYANAKIKKAMRIAYIFKFIPWVKMAAVGNMLGANNLKQESDIDFFIITAANRIWLTRFFCAGLAALLHLRPTPDNFRDKICLSFFVSETGLNLRNLLLTDDIYFVYWLANLSPIYNANNIYENFIVANSWLNQRLPNWQPVREQRQVKDNEFIFYRDFLDVTLGKLEKYIKKSQLIRLPKAIIEMINKDTRVVVNDSVLKFHVNDRREEYNNMFKKKVVEISNF